MRNLRYIGLYLPLLIVILLFSCNDSFDERQNKEIKEGIPVSVSLNYGVNGIVNSRTAQSDEVERNVVRMCAMAFYSNGELSGRSFHEGLDKNSSGTVEINMHSGAGQKIVLIANYNSGVGSLNRAQLEKVEKFDDLNNIISTLKSGSEVQVDRMAFLMSGIKENVSVDELGQITPGNVVIELLRVDARITFNIIAENNNYTNFNFQPKYYMVERIPQSVYVIPHDQDCNSSYVSMSEKNEEKLFDGTKEITVGGQKKSAHYFDFYMLENRQPNKKDIDENELSAKGDGYDNTGVEHLYALREKRYEIDNPVNPKPGQEYSLGEWVYAGENSTYVIIRGVLSYEDGGQFINADVKYTVHLGNTTSKGVNDYNTERNTHYTYNITITGVESIKVEVLENNEEKRPGMEGDVIVAGGDVKDMDSHYGRALFSLNKDEILAGLSWAFSTPFQRGMKVFEESNYSEGNESKLQTGKDLNDYKWVKFAVNADYPDIVSNDMVKFPGEAAYDGGEGLMDGTGTPAPAYGGDGASSAYYNATVKLYDVNQLLNYLYKEAKKVSPESTIFDINGNVEITAFVDEFVYKYNPTEVYYEEPDAVQSGDEDLLLWKKTVNGDNRILHICKAGAKYSPDGNSSWAESVISFSQRPIFTFYNPNNPDLKTAWGTESINETSELSIERTDLSTHYTNTNNNGRQNTLNVVYGKNLKWDKVVSTHNAGALLYGYEDIWHACMLRNRDLDGDNIIDENEVRWYLASIDQLTDLWIGEAAIPNAKLYTKSADQNNVPLEHVASSSYHVNTRYNNNPWIIWAEEGASRGPKSQDESYGNNYSYRCVRNLGLSLDDIDKVPDDYVVVTDGSRTINSVTYTEKNIDVSRMASNTLRPTSEDNLLPTPLTERDEYNNNRPPRKFAMIVSTSNNESGLYPQSGGIGWSTLYTNEKLGSPCPRGYRTPNQRELMLMYTTFPEYFGAHGYMNNGNYFYLCKTGFSFNGWGDYNNRIGFAFAYSPGGYGNLQLLPWDVSGKVRCVRDVP